MAVAKFNQIIDAIKAIVDATQYDGSSAFVDVKTYGTNEFSGYPSVVIMNNTISGDYETTIENMRRYRLQVYIYMNLESVDKENAWRVLRDLQESIIDDLDRTQNLDGIVDFIDPAGSEFFETDSGEGGNLLVAPITIEARYSFYFR